MARQVWISRGDCTSCQLCTDTAESVFEMDEEYDVARVVMAEIDEDLEDDVQEAIDMCPAPGNGSGGGDGCIYWVEDLPDNLRPEALEYPQPATDPSDSPLYEG